MQEITKLKTMFEGFIKRFLGRFLIQLKLNQTKTMANVQLCAVVSSQLLHTYFQGCHSICHFERLYLSGGGFD